ncbi:MAG: MCE family protein [Syntrophaceae bacterium]|jgi:phospholipid/cholesterol/gamma-HCH transport system substrate-binding protein|nr:MCE family protein [Syntrophaceae bacterium]
MQMYFRVKHFDRYVGILVVLAVILAIVALVFVGRGQKWFAHRVPFKVDFSKVQGLKPGTPVTISGMEVGNVASLRLNPQSRVELVIEILQQYQGNIRQDSMATIAAALIGGKTIEITVGSPDKPPLPAGSTIPSVDPREIADLLKEIDLKGSLKKIDEVLDNLNSITHKLDDPKGSLFRTLGNLEYVTGQLKSGQGNVGALLQDKKMHGEIHAAIAQVRNSLSNVEEITKNAAQVSQNLPPLMGEVDRSVKEIPKLVEELKKALAELPPILEDIKKTTAHTPAIAQNVKEITQDGKGVVKDVKEITAEVKKAAPQVPELLKTTQETTEDTDKLIQGLQNHWLLRGSMPRGWGERYPAVGQRESPYETIGEKKR